MAQSRLLAILGIAFVSLILTIEVTYSQTTTTTGASNQIDLTQIVISLINLAFPAVAAVATYLINANVKNQQMATLLSNAIQNGLGVVQQRAAATARQAGLTIDVGSPEIKAGVDYVLDNAREAIAHFKIPNERIAQKLSAKLGLAEIATNLAATASPMPVIVEPMASAQSRPIKAA